MLVIGKRSKEEVLHGLQGRFCIEPLSFEQVDRFTREDLQREAAYWKEQGRAVSEWTDRGYYLIRDTPESRPYYRYQWDRFYDKPPLYLYDNSDLPNLNSNCEMLAIELGLMAGVAASDVILNTRIYRSYLIGVRLLQEMREETGA